MNLSIVVPVRNEEGNVIPLHGEITRVLGGLKQEYELIVVDDGSTDGTFGCLSELALADSRLRVIRLRRNYGQTTALQAGIDVASGEVIVTMDGDRQNDPADIPHLLSRLAEGFDVVLGVRQSRQDGFLLRRLPSVLGNFLIRAVSRVPITDLGCALKAVRADFLRELDLYGEMHRYLAVLLHISGARWTEVATHHRQRLSGRTKYGLDRTVRVLLDLITILYLIHWSASPMRLFGRFGVLAGLVSIFSGVLTLFMKFQGTDMTGNPLLLLTVLSIFAMLQLLTLGILGEVCSRIHHLSRRRPSYAIRETRNLSAVPAVLRLGEAA
ncbi:MAG: glycosyltransferase family 2 protein [Planctomycetaceae bacterium]|jgi:glycosyltransferase involved in cell wall biosynthesis